VKKGRFAGAVLIGCGGLIAIVVLLVKPDPSPRFVFIGQTVDANGEPIPGVTVLFSYGDLWSRTSSSEPRLRVRGTSNPDDPLKTDAQGLFTIEGRGSYLWGLQFHRAGYLFEDVARKRYQTMSSRLTPDVVRFVGSRIENSDQNGRPESSTGQSRMDVGQAWSYASPPRAFGSEFHIVESFDHDECGRTHLIALRDLNGAQPWAYVWFSDVFLQENPLQEATATNAAPRPPRELRPEPGCYVEQLGVATLSPPIDVTPGGRGTRIRDVFLDPGGN